jgi:hypothetical protein
VKLGLIGKMKTGSRIEGRQWRTVDLSDLAETSPVDSGQFFIKLAQIIAGRNEQVPIETHKITIDLLFADDGFDPIDGFRVTLGRAPGTFLSMQTLDFGVAIIERIDKMSSGSACLATADLAIL